VVYTPAMGRLAIDPRWRHIPLTWLEAALGLAWAVVLLSLLWQVPPVQRWVRGRWEVGAAASQARRTVPAYVPRRAAPRPSPWPHRARPPFCG